VIVVVDDYQDACDFMVRFLKRSGFAATSYISCEAFLDSLSVGPLPGLVILDMHLPGMGGLECLRRLGASDAWRDIPVILYTADSDPERLQRAYELGARTCLLKGQLELDDLLKTIRQHRREPGQSVLA